MSGEVGNLRDALVQITLRLREDVLRDREGSGKSNASTESVYSGSLSGHSLLPGLPSAAPLGYDQRAEAGGGLGLLSGSSLYGYGALQVCHIHMRQLLNLTSEKLCLRITYISVALFCVFSLCFPCKAGDNGYGSLSSYSSRAYGGGYVCS